MKRAFGMDIPRTLEEACDPGRMVLLVYDMQVGIAGQLPHGPEITARVGEVLSAAREGGFPVFFSRHTSLPKELMGTFQLRQQMAWQRVDSVEEVRRACGQGCSKSTPTVRRAQEGRVPVWATTAFLVENTSGRSNS